MTVALGGLTTCAIAYLVTERGLRPAAVRALAEGGGETNVAPGVKARALLAWVVGPAIPMVGLMLIALSTLIEGDFTADELALSAITLCGVGLVIGLYITVLSARAVADPDRGRQRGRRRGRERQPGCRDRGLRRQRAGTAAGGLQPDGRRPARARAHPRPVRPPRRRGRGQGRSGARTWSSGARPARSRSCSWTWSARPTLASERPPQEVVEHAQPVLRDRGGRRPRARGLGQQVRGRRGAGDLRRAGTGARPRQPGACRGPRAQRAPARSVTTSTPASGSPRARWWPATSARSRRFEYTVIGDPVNEAARLTELAKSEGGVLASDAALEAASEEERAGWEHGRRGGARGRSKPTRPAKPRP